MIVLLYIGDHKKDVLSVRMGWYITRLVQKGPFKIVTHAEAVQSCNDDGSVTIASSSLRDKGVRTKTVFLEPENWLVYDMPDWDVEISREWFKKHDGEPYDIRGAIATVLPGHPRGGEWFCNQSVSDAFLSEAARFTPALFSSIVATFGKDITVSFMQDRLSLTKKNI
jgi:hypothetical protein